MSENILHGLYVLTDSKYYPINTWPERVESIILGGANIIQLREKTLSPDELLPHALILREICHHYDALFIINDHVPLARKVNADGVHIGKHDQSLRDARNYLGNKYLIGTSCYKHLYSAVRAQSLGADYVAFGSVFSSTTKIKASRCPLSIITQAKRCLSIPICAIGGINHNNVKHVLNAGAELIATSHTVFNAREPYDAANNMQQQVIMQG